MSIAELEEFVLDDEDLDTQNVVNNDVNNVNNDDWLTNYIKNEKLFDKFYKEETKNIKLFFLYIDKKREIIKSLKENHMLNDKIISKEDILKIISEKKTLLNKNFKLIQILKYNFNIDNHSIHKFVSKKDDFSFFKIIKEVEDIYWEDTISLFDSLNSLYFIFLEKKSKNGTKKIFLKKKKNKTKKRKNKELSLKKSDIVKI